MSNSQKKPTAPVKTAPVKTAPVKTAPIKTAPVKTAPIKTAPVKTAPVKTAPVKTAPVKTAPVKTVSSFMKEMKPSKELASVVGSASISRTQVVKKIWDYIKKNKLQDKTNKRLINSDAKLKLVFGKDQVNMLEISGLLQKHLS